VAEAFDPYYKWLGIPPKDQPPHHYRLLAIELFESDREVIDAAANRLMAYLKVLATGDDVAHSQRLLNEVAAARRCLLDPQEKAVYDARLSGPGGGAPAAAAASRKSFSAGKPPAPQTPRPSAAVRPAPSAPMPTAQLAKHAAATPAGQSAADFDFLDSPEQSRPATGHSGRHTVRKRTGADQNLTLWLAIGGGIAFVFLAGLVAVLSQSGPSSPRRSHGTMASRTKDRSPDGDEAFSSRSAARAERDDDTSSAVIPPAAVPLPANVQPPVPGAVHPLAANTKTEPPHSPAAAAAPPKSATPPAKPAAKPAPKAAPKLEPKPEPKPAPPADPFAALPEVLNLPPNEAGEMTPAPLCPLKTAPQQKVQLQLLGGDKVLASRDNFKLSPSLAKNNQWLVSLVKEDAESRPIAKFAMDGNQLLFVWLEDSPQWKPDWLRNCLLALDIDGQQQSRPLRKAVTVSPVALAAMHGRQEIRIPSLPDRALVQVDILGVAGPAPFNHSYAVKPVLAKVGSDTALPLEAVHATLHVTFAPLASNNGLVVTNFWTVKPPPGGANVATARKKFTKGDEQVFTRKLLPRGKLEQLQERERQSLLQDQQQDEQLRAQFPRGFPPPIKAQLDARKLQREAEQQELSYYRSLGKLDALSTTLRDQVRLHFRVFMALANQRVELAHTESPKAAAGN
jgi:hypothetical protein